MKPMPVIRDIARPLPPLALAAALALALPGTMAQANPAAGAGGSAPSPDPRKACPVEAVKGDLAKRNPSLIMALKDNLMTARCGSLKMVLRRLANGDAGAGRKLEPPRGLDLQEAERELAAARANPDIREALDIELAQETDPELRLLREAVVMHDKGQQKARDLLLSRIGQPGGAQ